MDEHFVPIVDYPNYEVSNYGRVINTVSGKDISTFKMPTGEVYVRLYNRGRSVIAMKRLVAQAFFTDYKAWSVVYLISEDHDDCSVMNITLKAPEHEEKPLLRPTKKSVRINELGETFPSLTAAAARIGGHASVISKILYGHGKTYKGYTFRLVEEQDS